MGDKWTWRGQMFKVGLGCVVQHACIPTAGLRLHFTRGTFSLQLLTWQLPCCLRRLHAQASSRTVSTTSFATASARLASCVGV